MKTFFQAIALAASTLAPAAHADTESIQGTYRAVLRHDGAGFYQYALFTLSTVNSGGGVLRISANVRMVYGDWNSNEFLTYDFADVPMNILTRQISLRDPTNDVSFIGQLGDGEITGDWYSSSVGRVGTFAAKKDALPARPEGQRLARSASGHYRGRYTNSNSQSNLPERMSLSLVTTQDMSMGRPQLVLSGNLRMFLGGFNSPEYYESPLKDVQFNFYTRYLTVKTEQWGLTIKGTLSLDGVLDGEVFADGLGRVGTVHLTAVE